MFQEHETCTTWYMFDDDGTFLLRLYPFWLHQRYGYTSSLQTNDRDPLAAGFVELHSLSNSLVCFSSNRSNT